MATLIDKVTRHQVLLEGLKNYREDVMRREIGKLYRELKIALLGVDKKSLGEFTKQELRALISTVSAIHDEHELRVTNDLLIFLREFMEADREIAQTMYREDDDDAILLPFSYDRQWATVTNAPMAATGETIGGFLAAYFAGIRDETARAIRRGYADHLDTREVVGALVGAAVVGSVERRVGHQGASIINTALQHVAQFVHHQIGRVLYGKYIWLSILDGRTSQICRRRHKSIYRYGAGPLPPAHPNCRSRAVPYTSRVNVDTIPNTYWSWLRTQPAKVQDAFLGGTRGAAMREGALSADDLPGFEPQRSLTLSQFVGKRGLINTD